MLAIVETSVIIKYAEMLCREEGRVEFANWLADRVCKSQV